MSLQNRLIFFYFVTSLGSALSSIAAFLNIENYFESLIFLGIALSVKTLASAVFSYSANYIIQMLGLRWSLVVSQVFGILALAVLLLGFHFDIFIITLFGIVLTGLPSTFVAILISIILRLSSEDSEIFRKYSGRRELVFGMGMLLASILAPLLLWKYSLNFVFCIDAVTYLFGLVLLTNLRFKDHYSSEEEGKKPVSLRQQLYLYKDAKSFMIKTSASLLLAGLLPLLASSGKVPFTIDMPVLIRQWLWSIEDITAISASVLYLLFVALRKHRFSEALVMLNGAWLFLPLILDYRYTIIITAVIICLLTDFSGQKFRDDLIVSAGNDVNLIKSYSALSQFQRNFIFFISPILLSVVFSYTAISICVAVIFFIQLILFMIYRFILGDSAIAFKTRTFEQ